MPAGKLQVVPLGGLGEFGMNCMAVRWADHIVVIDAGLMFPEAELLGVDIVVPDITYLVENRDKVRAIVGARAVLGAGVILTRSTPIYDAVRGEIYRASAEQPLTVPENAVVVPGARAV